MKQKKCTKFKEFILNLIFPRNIKCIFCGEELKENDVNNTCKNCFCSLPFVSNPCKRCGGPMIDGQVGVCQNCKRHNFDFALARTVFVYDEMLIKIIHSLKYNGNKYLIPPLTKYLLQAFATWDIFPDIVTCVPMYPSKEKVRGYNQSKELAKEFSKATKIPFVELCDKVIDNPSQASLGMRERLINVVDTYALKSEHKKLIKGKTILIIDDVMTTGATCSEVSKVLRHHGASVCHALTLAHGMTSVQTDEEQSTIDS
ncbi:MAG: ComF family protein [Clostridiales bacterium]|nr:ComF family protein [Clostridiales bacterium]